MNNIISETFEIRTALKPSASQIVSIIIEIDTGKAIKNIDFNRFNIIGEKNI